MYISTLHMHIYLLPLLYHDIIIKKKKKMQQINVEYKKKYRTFIRKSFPFQRYRGIIYKTVE